jgi:hypothetical protein
MRILFIITIVFLSSCFKKEKPFELPIGESNITSFYLGENYENQIFFDLGTNTYQTKDLFDWDLRFETGKNQFGVFINNGKDIRVRKTNLFNLDEPLTLDTSYLKSLPVLIDEPEGKVDKSAIGNWSTFIAPGSSKPGIYVIELIDQVGWDRFVRMQILDVNDTQYVCKFSPMVFNNKLVTEWNQLTYIPKQSNQNFTYFSFKSGGYVLNNAEPDKRTWDLEFTKYKHIFYNYGPNPFPYLVTGVLSNPNNVTVAIDSVSNFNDINSSFINKYQFSSNRNGVGFEWKSFDFNTSFIFTVKPNLTYIIKDTDDKLYKLRFIDFYNEQRVKGYPKFEFILIK